MTNLTLAIPSKGRLKEKSEEWLTASGFKLRQLGGGRGYTASIDNLPDTQVMLLSAREIAEGLIAGDLHVGITGEDLVHDLSSHPERDVHCFRRLGFGNADVVVAVPGAWLDVDTMADLEAAAALFRSRHGRQMRVATKYLNLTRRFFAQRALGEYRLIESAGATEAAPAAGSAEIIVDITSSGATLRANQLKVLEDGVILASEATLFGANTADWSTTARQSLEKLLAGIEAAAAGRELRRLTAAVPISDTLIETHKLMHAQNTSALCEKDRASDVARSLALALKGPVTVTKVDQVFTPSTDAYDIFVKNMS